MTILERLLSAPAGHLSNYLLNGERPMDAMQSMRALGQTQNLRASLPNNDPFQKPLAERDRTMYVRSLMNEGQYPLAMGMPFLSAGEQGLKGLQQIFGGQRGRSGFHPESIGATVHGLRLGLGDILSRV